MRRSDIDWEAIEQDYRAGLLTIQAIREKHGVSHSQIREKAKKHGWPRDLSAAIQARAREKISAIDVADLIEKSASKSAQASAECIISAVEQAADVVTGVLLRHRSYLARQHELAKSIEDRLDEDIKSKELPSPQLAGALKNLIDARHKCIEQERVIYKIPTGPDQAPMKSSEELKRELDRLLDLYHRV